jgi:putative lipoprotein
MRTIRRIGLLGLAVTLLGWIGMAMEGAQDAPEAKPKHTMRPAMQWKRFDYTCEKEVKVTVYLHETTAKVRFQEQTYMMRQTRSADGNRYSDGKTLWWGKGDGGLLQEEAPDGDGKMLAKDCVLQKAAAADTVTGTITYLVRMALPPQATIVVELQDVSLVDAPAKVLAAQKFALGQQQVPVPFTLQYNPAKIDAKHRYAVNARVMIGKELKFVTDQAYPVLTQGNGSRVDLILKPAKP